MPAPAVGIDLGTTFSCVAVYKAGGAEIIRNDMGKNITPSYVGFTPTSSQRLIGEAAKTQAHRNAENTYANIYKCATLEPFFWILEAAAVFVCAQ